MCILSKNILQHNLKKKSCKSLTLAKSTKKIDTNILSVFLSKEDIAWKLKSKKLTFLDFWWNTLILSCVVNYFDVIHTHKGVLAGVNVVTMETCLHWICLSTGGNLLRVTRLQNATKPTWDVGPTFVYCWPTVYDVDPTVNKRWVNFSCWLANSIIMPSAGQSCPHMAIGPTTAL